MNLQVPQTYEAKAEVLDVMNVKNCQISDQTSKPITGIIQDALTGAYLLTGEHVVVRKELWNDAVFAADREDMVASLERRVEEKKLNLYSGRSLFSILFPEDFVFVRTIDGVNYEIKDGILVSGQMNKDVLSSGPNSILQVMHRRYGQDVTVEFNSNLQKLVNHWVQEEGFSVGYGSCLFERLETYKEIEKTIEKTKKRAMGKVEDPLLALKQESEINQQLNNSRNLVAKIILEENVKHSIPIDEFVKKITIITTGGERVLDHEEIVNLELNIPKNLLVATLRNGDRKEIDSGRLVSVSIATEDNSRMFVYRTTENPFKSMLNAKSKGTNLNISQIMGNVGQQNLYGQRIQFSLTNDTRVLPHFESNDLNPEARGFCSSGYFQGLNPLELFMANVAGREGLTDTVTKTQETGYIQRRLATLMEDLVTQTDGTVRDATGQLIQYQYGSHGFSTDRMVKVGGQFTFTDVGQRLLEMKRKRSKFAYVYFASSQEAVKSILVSVHSLNKTKSENDIVVLVTDAISPVSKLFLKKIATRVIPVTTTSPWWALNLTEYEKVLYLSPEMIILRNMDHLFKLDAPSATFSRYFAVPYTRNGEFNPYEKYQVHGDKIPSEVVATALERGQFISTDAMFLLKPDEKLWKKVQELENPSLRHIEVITRAYLGTELPFYELHQIHQLLPLSDKSSIWLNGTKYVSDDAFALNFASDILPWQNKTRDAQIWFDYMEDMLVENPEMAVFYDYD